MNDQREVAVTLVAYKPELSPFERISANRCLEVLGCHPIVVVAPEGLAVPAPLDRLPVERFAPSCFAGIAAYNSLLLSKQFYRRFLDYRYVLIHQLDVFVFRDELLDWCAKGYSYIGAPWVGEDWPKGADIRQGLPFWTRSRLFKFLPPLDTQVGNGGFSLRRVRDMIRATSWLKKTKRAWGGRNEDSFFSIAVPECWWWIGYRIPPAEEAMSFSFETQPSARFAEMGNRLPFGCHGWDKHDPTFWHPHLAALGYDFDLPAARCLEEDWLARRCAKRKARMARKAAEVRADA